MVLDPGRQVGIAALLGALLLTGTALAHHEPISTSRWRAHAADGAVGATITLTGPDAVAVARLATSPLPEPGSPDRERVIHARIRDAVAESIALANDGQPCQRVPLQVFVRKGYEVSVRWQCGGPLGRVSIIFGFLERLSADHQHVVQLDTGVRSGPSGGVSRSAKLDRMNATLTHDFRGSSASGAPVGPDIGPDPGAPAIGFAAALRLGLHHIAVGADHILFILGILLVARTPKSVIALATVFTAAHSVTLALAVLDLVVVPSAVVEPLIAASLVAIAAEARVVRSQPGCSGRRGLVVFGFGLLHGLGFAGGLTDLNLTGMAAVEALFGFNIGVETGQLLVALLVFPWLWMASPHVWFRSRVVLPASGLIALAGVWWTVERLVG